MVYSICGRLSSTHVSHLGLIEENLERSRTYEQPSAWAGRGRMPRTATAARRAVLTASGIFPSQLSSSSLAWPLATVVGVAGVSAATIVGVAGVSAAS